MYMCLPLGAPVPVESFPLSEFSTTSHESKYLVFNDCIEYKRIKCFSVVVSLEVWKNESIMVIFIVGDLIGLYEQLERFPVNV